MKTLLHSICFFVFSCFLIQQEVYAQCSPSDFQIVEIDPDSTIVASLIIENALNNNDLSDPGQGVCGVKINFTHNSVKEVEVRLISPAGQVIELIGPISPDGSITFSPQWNISFLPCNETVIPDPGFSNPWTNTDNWAGPGTYNGSYHPYQECLEDAFNDGPVNGLWSLEILNSSRFDGGDLISFEIEFCDDSFDCKQCVPTPGSFEQFNLVEDYCEGSSELDFDFTSLIQDNSDGYGYQFYILEGNDIIEVVDDPDLSSYDPGAYQICGLSFYSNQESELVDLPFYDALSAFYKSAQSKVCAQFTETCFSLNVFSFLDTISIDTSMCVDGSFLYNGITYDTPGNYTDQLGDGVCDTLVLINLEMVEIEALISNESDLLTCDNERIELGVGSSILSSETEVVWRTEGGSFEEDPASNSIFVTQAGRYWLILSEGVCADSFFVDIAIDADVPILDMVISDTLDCNVDMVNIIVNSDPEATSYIWSGPENNLPDDQNIKISTAGVYSVTVSLPSGCSSIESKEVIADFSEPELEIVTKDITCTQEKGTAEILNIAEDIAYSFDRGGDVNAMGQIEYSSPGEYTITATFEDNGCASDTTFQILADIQEPLLSFEPVENISCGNLSVDIVVNADLDIDSYSWIGPNGLLGLDQNIVNVDYPGDYMVSVIATNGCTNDASQTIISDNADLPSISISADAISCNSSTAQITTTADRDDLSYSWVGVNGFVSDLQNPVVTEAGKYYLSAFVSDNCEIIDSVLVEEDVVVPDLTPSALPISCNNQMTTLIIENQDPTITYNWLDIDGSVLQGLDPSVDLAGEYTLQGIGSNGCPNSVPLIVSIDTISPTSSALAPQLLMCDRTQVNLSGDGSSIGAEYTYAWSTSDGSVVSAANTLTPLVSATGTYEIVVTNQNNGCSSNASILLQETRSDISDFEYEKFDPPCADAPLGRIVITEVAGGEGPYTYSVDGINFQDDPNLQALSAQVYTVTVKDMFGCEIADNVIIEDGLDVSVDLEESYDINLGDELLIESILNTNGDPLRSIDWNLSGQPIATGDERISVRPLSSTIVEVSIQTVSGCSSSAMATINISKEKDIYTPNIISASDFGENGQFTVYPSNAVQEIRSIDIFDRWGNKVYAADSYDPRIETKSWDGTHNSQNLIPGIYVYLIEVLLIDGEQRVIPGEVLLVR